MSEPRHQSRAADHKHVYYYVLYYLCTYLPSVAPLIQRNSTIIEKYLPIANRISYFSLAHFRKAASTEV